jgi:hypothetical protein
MGSERRKTMARDRQAEEIREWRMLLKSGKANTGDVDHLEKHLGKLETFLIQVDDIEKQQALLTASKQEASKQLRTLLVDGSKVATFIKAGLREHYGNRAEKLVEFGLRPFRGRPRKVAKPEEPVKPPAEPAAPVDSPTQR